MDFCDESSGNVFKFSFMKYVGSKKIEIEITAIDCVHLL